MSSKVIKLEIGTVYQKTKNGNYYFRYQVKGQRKAVSLKTKNRQKALNKAQALIPILKASSTEVISAHVQRMLLTIFELTPPQIFCVFVATTFFHFFSRLLLTYAYMRLY